MSTICWHFNIYEHDGFHVQLRLTLKRFYNIAASYLPTELGTPLLHCIKKLKSDAHVSPLNIFGAPLVYRAQLMTLD